MVRGDHGQEGGSKEAHKTQKPRSWRRLEGLSGSHSPNSHLLTGGADASFPSGVQFRRGIGMKISTPSTRRQLLRIGAALSGGLLARREGALAGESAPGRLGVPLGPYGERSPFEKTVRWRRESKTPETGSSFTPLQDSVGTLTPSSLHYERHHAGIPTIDPSRHRLVIHGMVERPISLTVAEIRRLPSVSRTLVLECGGNSGSEWQAKTAPDVQRSHGLASCSEWTGVPLSLLLMETGIKAGASWVIAEGADACRMERSIPLSKAL